MQVARRIYRKFGESLVSLTPYFSVVTGWNAMDLTASTVLSGRLRAGQTKP